MVICNEIWSRRRHCLECKIISIQKLKLFFFILISKSSFKKNKKFDFHSKEKHPLSKRNFEFKICKIMEQGIDSFLIHWIKPILDDNENLKNEITILKEQITAMHCAATSIGLEHCDRCFTLIDRDEDPLIICKKCDSRLCENCDENSILVLQRSENIKDVICEKCKN